MDDLILREIRFTDEGTAIKVVMPSDISDVVIQVTEYFVTDDLGLLGEGELAYWYKELHEAAREFAWRAKMALQEAHREAITAAASRPQS